MVEFFTMTGSFATVGDIVKELPRPIETNYALYMDPAALLAPYLDLLAGFVETPADEVSFRVVNENGGELDPVVARNGWIKQQILTMELEKINSALCGVCNCTLCCTGPSGEMVQEFFEIPLREGEPAAFGESPVVDNGESRTRLPMDEDELIHEGLPFWADPQPTLIHWKKGWSLILPKKTCCPNLIPENGRCRSYETRPSVCRRPQIFPYILEPLDDQAEEIPTHRLRNIILAITDCPYVNDLRDEISAYIAACELEPLFMRNKQ